MASVGNYGIMKEIKVLKELISSGSGGSSTEISEIMSQLTELETLVTKIENSGSNTSNIATSTKTILENSTYGIKAIKSKVDEINVNVDNTFNLVSNKGDSIINRLDNSTYGLNALKSAITKASGMLSNVGYFNNVVTNNKVSQNAEMLNITGKGEVYICDTENSTYYDIYIDGIDITNGFYLYSANNKHYCNTTAYHPSPFSEKPIQKFTFEKSIRIVQQQSAAYTYSKLSGYYRLA